MDQLTTRICVPAEAVSIGILGQAIYINDKCYIIRSIELSESDPSMINLKGALKIESKKKKNNRPVTHFLQRSAPDDATY